MNVIDMARGVFEVEIEALKAIGQRIDGEFERAIELILEARGRVVVVGMGKSGIIGKKIAATLASTGTHSFFVHPGEAFHGDLGMIRDIDVVLMISNSGETEELIRLLPFMEYQKNSIVAMTGNRGSTLARHAHAVLDISVPREACNNNLAPTSSTTATLVMGDALAVTLSTLRGFQPEDFARFHPGGSLGRKLLARVSDVMHRGNLPFCAPAAGFREVVHIVTRGRMGLVMVMESGKLVGLITDGDIRRSLERSENPLALSAAEMMTSTPLMIGAEERFAVAEERMREAKVNSLIVTADDGAVVGVLQIFDLGSGSVQA
ncbi:MAG: KpsF/GutQ family sugar-phosphate isomerase [Thauera sp.]